MSIEIMSYAWKHSRAKGASLLVLLAIADHARDDGKAWPGLESIAYKTRVNKRTVQRAIDELESLGEIKVLRQGTGRAWSIYRVMKSGMTRDDKETQETDPEDFRGDICDTRGDIDDTRGGDTPPESLIKQTSIKQTSNTLSPVGDARRDNRNFIEREWDKHYALENHGEQYVHNFPAERKGINKILSAGFTERYIVDRITLYFDKQRFPVQYNARSLLTFLSKWSDIGAKLNEPVKANASDPESWEYEKAHWIKYHGPNISEGLLAGYRKEWERKHGK